MGRRDLYRWKWTSIETTIVWESPPAHEAATQPTELGLNHSEIYEVPNHPESPIEDLHGIDVSLDMNLSRTSKTCWSTDFFINILPSSAVL
jgi:hypothetical protein